MKNRIFFDTEFTGIRQDTTLVSIGMVDEPGNTLYVTLNDYDREQIEEWLWKNVIPDLVLEQHRDSPHFKSKTEGWGSEIEVDGLTHQVVYNVAADECMNNIQRWLVTRGKPHELELWSDVPAYDMVLLDNLFKDVDDKPYSFYVMDLATAFRMRGIDPDVTREEYAGLLLPPPFGQSSMKHNALWDALIIRECVRKLDIPHVK